jgi:sugar lactone lactonase YvrE
MSKTALSSECLNAPWHRLSPHALALGESPRQGHGQLRWVDIQDRTMHVLNIDNLSISASDVSIRNPGIDVRPMPDQIACIIPSTDPNCWIGFGRQGIWHIRDDGLHTCILPAPFEPSWQRFNDGCCDQWGRIWITSLIDDKRAPLAKLWCLQKGVLHEVLDGLTTGNGMAYSHAHRKLWLADTYARRIRRFDVNAHSTALVADGWSHTYTYGTERPDGACMLDEDHYVVAVIDGQRLDVFNIQSEQAVASIPVCASKPTMPCTLSKPAPSLVLSTAQSNAASTAHPASSGNADDGFVLAKSVCMVDDITHLYSP